MKNTTTTDVDKEEEKFIASFRSHELFQSIESIPLDKLLQILIQRRFLSFTLTTVYDIAIDALTDMRAIKIARQILREEYPDMNGNTPSHREELVHDLIFIGAKKTDILCARPTSATTCAIEETLLLVNNAAAELSDLKLLTILRFWGEVLVSTEYGEFWKRLSKQFFVDGKIRSRFYYPHYCHDSREPIKQSSLLSSTHSGRLGSRLQEMLDNEESRNSFLEVEKEILNIKTKFYNQFVEPSSTGLFHSKDVLERV